MLSAAILVTPFVLRGRPISRRYGAFLTLVYLVYILSLYHGMSGMPKTDVKEAVRQSPAKHSVQILSPAVKLLT